MADHFEDVQRQYDWTDTSAPIAILESIAVLEYGDPCRAIDVLDAPFNEYVEGHALDEVVGSDAPVSISLTISDYHVSIRENTVCVTGSPSTSETTR